MKVLIVYYSTYGHVHKMAEAVAEGVKEVAGAEVALRRVPETLAPAVLEKMGAVEAQNALSHVPVCSVDELAEAGLDPGTLLFTRQPYLDSLDHHAFSYEMIESFDHYHTTMVTGTFLNHKTRGEALRKQYLLEIAGRNE